MRSLKQIIGSGNTVARRAILAVGPVVLYVEVVKCHPLVNLRHSLPLDRIVYELSPVQYWCKGRFIIRLDIELLANLCACVEQLFPDALRE